ncbi:MAG: amidohydrolase, partial [Candidatus Nanohaloarchaea archaeon]
IGSIREGKAADLVTVDLSRPEMRPVHGTVGLLSNLVFSFDGTVSDVLVDGKLLVRDGVLTGMEKDDLRQDVQDRADRIRTAARD